MKCKGRKQFVPTQFTQMSIRAAGAALADHFVVYQADGELSNALVLGTSIIMFGSNAARPAASIAGRLYFTTDEPNRLYRDNGASWDTITATIITPAARGEILAANALLDWRNLALGANKTVLRSNGTDPVWSTTIVLTDPDAVQKIQPTGNVVSLAILPFTDPQNAEIFQVANAAYTKAWFVIQGDGSARFNTLTPRGLITAGPPNDSVTAALLPFSDAQANEILQVTDAAYTKSHLAVQGNGKVRIGTGVVPDGGGLKHARVSYGNLAAGASTSVTITWGTAFADANYTVTLSIFSTGEHSVTITALSASAIIVLVVNHGAGSDGGGIVNAIAMHD